MTDYTVTTYSTQGTMDEVLAAIKAKLETINNGKTIRLLGVERTNGSTWVGFLIYDT